MQLAIEVVSGKAVYSDHSDYHWLPGDFGLGSEFLGNVHSSFLYFRVEFRDMLEKLEAAAVLYAAGNDEIVFLL